MKQFKIFLWIMMLFFILPSLSMGRPYPSNLGLNLSLSMSPGVNDLWAWPVVSMDTGGNISLGNKTITVSSSSAQTLNLPVISSSNLGTTYTIVKLNTGRVTIQANTGQYIANSSSAGTIYNSTQETYATITIMAVTTTKWIIIGAMGTWTTS